MQPLRAILLVGATAALFSAGIAAAKSPDTHVMTVRLPGGVIEEIRYSGDVPPRVNVEPQEMPMSFGWPAAFFGPDSSFAEFHRISAEMHQRMDSMLREARTLAQRGAVTEIDSGGLPPGSQGYSFVSTMRGDGVCAKSVEITSRGNGEKPQVVSRTWGNCGQDRGTGVHSLAPAVAQPSDVRTIRYDSRAPAPKFREAGLF